MFIRFDFNGKWRFWMFVYVFSENLVVLVNDCLTKKLGTKEVEEMWSSNSVFVPVCGIRLELEWFVY